MTRPGRSPIRSSPPGLGSPGRRPSGPSVPAPMRANPGEILFVANRQAWRSWLRRNHRTEREVWLVYYAKASGKPRIPYNDAVDEALCFGWIDSMVKRLDDGGFAQRFTPRRTGSRVSELNKARVRRLLAEGRMTGAGLAALAGKKDLLAPPPLVVPADIRRALQDDPGAWRHFQAFPEAYRRIRIGWIEGARSRPDVFQTRLRYFVRMTRENKCYGMVQE